MQHVRYSKYRIFNNKSKRYLYRWATRGLLLWRKTSETAGARYDINPQPSQHHGNYAWCRIKFNNGMLSQYWVLDDKYNSVPQSYGYCVAGVSWDVNFRTKLFLMQNEHIR